jgi:hypothetical protein
MNGDITLPLEVSNGKLTLEEIGAIFVLFSLPKIEDEELKTSWSNDDYLGEVLQSMIDRKIVEYDTKDGILEIQLNISDNTIDIEWETDYDNDKNVIYHLYGRFGKNQSDHKYTVKPTVSGNKLQWNVTHSVYKIIDEIFDNLDDAKQFAEDQREQEFEQ